jgi:transcription elongation factor GreA
MPSTTAAELLRSVGLLADGPARWGRPAGVRAAGVYVVELPSAPEEAPIELTRVGKWIERATELRLDRTRPTSRALAARLASFWLPGQPVLFVGSTSGSIAARVVAFEHHVLGDRRPHAAGHWLKTLNVEPQLRVWWAETDAPEEYEDALLATFAERVGESARVALPAGALVLPFANLSTPTGERRSHGITGSVRPEPGAPPERDRRVVTVPEGDAEGARPEPRGTGTTRRTNPRPPRPPASQVHRPRRASPPGRASEPVHLSSEGLARIRGELDELTRNRRPAVIARIRAAKELGDLRENADYAAAREEQSFLEGRIQALEGILRNAVEVEAATGPTVAMGSRVVVEHGGEQTEYTIVSPAEADPAAGRISTASPVGRALVGQSPGAEVTVRTPNGDARYRIVDLR